MANAKPEGALGLGHAIIEDYLCQQNQDRYTTYLDVVFRSRSCGLSLSCPPVADRRQYLFHKRDPRRYQVLVDYLVQEFHSTDYNGESSLNAVKALCFFRAFYEEQNWKFSQWVDQAVERVWAEISSEHDEASYITTTRRTSSDPPYCPKVRAYISELLAFASKIKVSKLTCVRA